MKVLLIDSGITNHKALSSLKIYPTGYNGQNHISDLEDNIGHGTAVAGLIVRNQLSVELYVIKLFDDTFKCSANQLIDALHYVLEMKIRFDIINMSFGLTHVDDFSELLELERVCKSLRDCGTILVAAYDNEGAISYPAFFPCVLGVDSSPNVSGKSEIEYIQSSCVNLRGFGCSQKVIWPNPDHTVISGNSFACANVTNKIITLLKDSTPTTNIETMLKKISLTQYNFDNSSPVEERPSWLDGAKAIFFPFAKEIHSLLAYETELVFSVTNVFDLKHFGRIGQNVSRFLTYKSINNRLIKNFETIPWQSDEFDVIIAGHLDDISWRYKCDVLKLLIEKCCMHHKKMYSFDDLSLYSTFIDSLGGDSKDFFYPHIDKQSIPKGRFGKLHEIITPVVAVVGTSSSQGKFTVQLALREQLLKAGFKVGQIGSEPSAYCFGMDYTFPDGYHSTVNIDGFERIMLLNELMHDLDRKCVDICIVGTQSNSIPYSTYNLAAYPLRQQEFLYGTQPDAFFFSCESAR